MLVMGGTEVVLMEETKVVGINVTLVGRIEAIVVEGNEAMLVGETEVEEPEVLLMGGH